MARPKKAQPNSPALDHEGFIHLTAQDAGTGFVIGLTSSVPTRADDDVVQHAPQVLEGRMRVHGPSLAARQQYAITCDFGSPTWSTRCSSCCSLMRSTD